jgi:acyl-CoA thioesterase YciA
MPWTTALRIQSQPRDTNQYGTIFGGVILSGVDQAGFIEARRHGVHRWVTAAIDSVTFLAPVQVGDVVSYRTRTVATGTSSVTVEVMVEAERFTTGDVVKVTQAKLVMVAVNAAGRPIPYSSAPSVAIPTIEPMPPGASRRDAPKVKEQPGPPRLGRRRRGGSGRGPRGSA